MDKKITPTHDGLKVIDAPEKYFKCEKIMICLDKKFHLPVCKCYTQALEQAIKEGVKFKDEGEAEFLVFQEVNKIFGHMVYSMWKPEQGKLYDIPEGYCIEFEVDYEGEKREQRLLPKYAILKPLTKQEPERTKCIICEVPTDIHGTCCGWINATAKCDVSGKIIDANHIGYGQNNEDWRNSLKKCNGNCGMNYCDENGCVERKRILTEPVEPESSNATPVIEQKEKTTLQGLILRIKQRAYLDTDEEIARWIKEWAINEYAESKQLTPNVAHKYLLKIEEVCNEVNGNLLQMPGLFQCIQALIKEYKDGKPNQSQ